MTADSPGEVASFPSVAAPGLKTKRLGKIKWVVLAGIVAAAVFSVMTPPLLIIEEIAVPKDLLDDGYTPRLVATRLAIQIEMIRQAARSDRHLIGALPHGPTDDILVSGVTSPGRRAVALL